MLSHHVNLTLFYENKIYKDDEKIINIWSTK